MSTDLSADVLAAVYAESTDFAFLELVVINHEDLAAPIRLTNNSVDIVSRGDTYLAFPFRAQMPPEVEGELPKIQIAFDNVSQLLIAELRQIQTPPTVDLEIIASNDLDVVEAGPWNFTMKGISYDTFTIEADLAHEDLLTEPYPYERFTPTNFPGLFERV